MSEYNLISAKSVVGKVYRDLRLTDSMYVIDMIEWVGEAMEFIAVFPSLRQKQVKLTVADYSTKLPADVAQIYQVAKFDEADNLCPLRYNARTFPQRIFDAASPNKKSTDKTGFIVNYGYIETDMEEGTIALAYLAYPVDCDNFPLVLDLIPYREALKWYIVTRMIEGGWKHPAGLSFEKAEARWKHYCAQARQRANMPDISQYQHFLENWVRMVPDYERFDTMFDEQWDASEGDYVSADNIVVRGVDQLNQYNP